MMLFKKALPRRTFLRGVGTTLALPLLDSMVPAMAAARQTAAKPVTRFGIVYVPNGIIMDRWTPATEDATLQLTPTVEPLARYRDRILVLTGLENKAARAPAGEIQRTGPHASAAGAFLTGVHPKPPGEAGVSVDQIAAGELGKHTPLASLELTLDRGETGAGADAADTDAYLNTICWRSATTPLPMENNPRKVFERLFGDSDSTDPADRLRRWQQNRSILDFVIDEVASLAGTVGAGDRAKLTEYLDGIRDLERRIQIMEERASPELPALARPGGLPATYEEHAKLMFDLEVLAYQTDMTRVITFAMAREKSERQYRELGIDEAHHALSHHDYDAALMAKVAQINVYHTKTFAYFLDRMQATPDGDGSLLDHSVILYASSMSDGMAHNPRNLPLLLLGGAAAQLKGGRHLRYKGDPPVTNLFLTMLDKAGVAVDSFGNSTGEVDLLSVV
jgi:hypothetical protein